MSALENVKRTADQNLEVHMADGSAGASGQSVDDATIPQVSRSHGPLQGIRVVDLTTIVLGPYASQFLGEYGADVIKIEAPGGDSTRQVGPCKVSGMSALFLGVNRNKRSVELDLKAQEGREAFLKLIRHADVFLHNMRPEKLEALGLGEGVLRGINQNLVFAALLGFGSNGPYAGQPAYDDVIQGLSGLAAMVEAQTGAARYLPTTVADKVAALIAVQAILAALLERSKTGTGCSVEIPMFEALVTFGLVEHMQGAHFEPALGSIGYRRALMAERRPCPTSDGYLCIMPYSDQHWRSFFLAVGDQEAADDPRYQSVYLRTQHVSELYARLARHIAQRTTVEWLAICRKLDIPAARMNQLDDLLEDEHLRAVSHFVSVEDSEMGGLVFPANPVRFDGWRPSVGVPPRLGQHTAAILAALDEGWPAQ